jgi:hypothetical protein
MAASDIAQNYVYALFREDGVTPFYIGIGKGSRWLAHEKYAWRNRGYKARTGIMHSQQTKEKLRIASTGRKQTAETIEKRKRANAGFKHSKKSIEKMRAIQSNRSTKTREELRIAARKRWATFTQEERNRMGATIRNGMGQKTDPSEKLKPS